LRCCDEGFDCVDGECRAPLTCGEGGACTVFITNSVFAASFGSAQAADSNCQAAAANAGLTGTYRAWLSDSNSSPSTRFARASGPYVRVDGVEVAANWADLTDGALLNPILINEFGLPVAGLAYVWTATDISGALVGTTPCENWTSSNLGEGSVLGSANMTNSSWTAGPGGACQGVLSLYCFEQSE
jgi:hypothetical protein